MPFNDSVTWLSAIIVCTVCLFTNACLLYVGCTNTTYVQKKKTIYPEWNTCFDAHLYEGRLLEFNILERGGHTPTHMIAESRITAQILADKCAGTQEGIASCWVSGIVRIDSAFVGCWPFLRRLQTLLTVTLLTNVLSFCPRFQITIVISQLSNTIAQLSNIVLNSYRIVQGKWCLKKW